MLDIMQVTLPASLLATVLAALWSMRRGLELADDPEFQARLADPVQRAFIAEQALQCGFCISGPVLEGMAYVDKHPNATGAEIEKALSGVLCRCYAQPRMVKALLRYAREKRA